MTTGWKRVTEFEPCGRSRTLGRRNEVVVDETPSGVSNSVPPAVLEAEGTGTGSLGGGMSTGARRKAEVEPNAHVDGLTKKAADCSSSTATEPAPPTKLSKTIKHNQRGTSWWHLRIGHSAAQERGYQIE